MTRDLIVAHAPPATDHVVIPPSSADVLLGSLDLDVQGYSPAKALRFYQVLLRQVRAQPSFAQHAGTISPQPRLGPVSTNALTVPEPACTSIP